MLFFKMSVSYKVTEIGILMDMNLFIFGFYFSTMVYLYEFENDLQNKDVILKKCVTWISAHNLNMESNNVGIEDENLFIIEYPQYKSVHI